jgi:hypothetical protein
LTNDDTAGSLSLVAELQLETLLLEAAGAALTIVNPLHDIALRQCFDSKEPQSV